MELPQDTQICPSCGKSTGKSAPASPQEYDNSMQQPVVPPPQIYADPPTYEPEPVKKPRKKGVFFKVVAIILLAAILISGVTVLGYYTFLPAQNVLTTAQYFTVQKHNKYIEATMKRGDVRYKALYEDSFKTESEISLLLDKQLFINFGGVDEKTADLIDQYLKNVSLRINFGADVPNEQLTASLGLLVLKNPAMSLNLFMDKTRLGFSLPELSPTIITGEIKDITRLSELFPGQFGEGQVEVLPEIDLWDSLKTAAVNKLSAADAQKLTSTYSAALVKGLQFGKMSIKRGRSTELFDKDISCQEITVKLDPEAQKQVIITLLDTMMEDETTYNFIKNTFGVLYQKYIEGLILESRVTRETPTELTKVVYKNELKELKKNLKELDEEGLPEEITVKVYINGLDVVKYTVSVPVTPGGEEIVIAYENLLVDDDIRTKLSLTGDIQGRVMAFSIYMESIYDQASDTQDSLLECGLNLEMTPDASIKANLTISSTEEPQGKGKVKKNINVDLTGEKRELGEETETLRFSFDLEGDETRNNDGLCTSGDYTGKLEMAVPTLPRSVELGYALTTKTTYGEKLDIPDLSKEKVLDWGTATQDDFNAYLNELEQKLSFIMLMLGSF